MYQLPFQLLPHILAQPKDKHAELLKYYGMQNSIKYLCHIQAVQHFDQISISCTNEKLTLKTHNAKK